MLVANEPVCACSGLSVVDECLIGILSLIETAFRGEGTRLTIAVEHEELIGIVAKFQGNDSLIAWQSGIVVHLIGGEETVVGEVAVDVDVVVERGGAG